MCNVNHQPTTLELALKKDTELEELINSRQTKQLSIYEKYSKKLNEIIITFYACPFPTNRKYSTKYL
jgi:hypothetical protein